ncbi:MAG: ATP phosphoribosyltransferase [Clostridiales bacterium]|jgi:ATP phosphoribosyltransferase|nr:ATP phosphoribosyltransferase [Clostridiales bacterium]
MGYLTFALTKGRLAEDAKKTLADIGLACEEMKEKSRKLIFVNEEQRLRFFLAKADDVPTYVEYGAADIGISGADSLLEEGRNLYEAMDLGFGKCRMVVAGPPEIREKMGRVNNIRVSTKYPNIAARHFYQKRRQTAEIVKLNGSVELGPIVGLSDVIVDIVESGSTLQENGLVVLEEVCDISARLVVNRVSMKTEYDRITDIIRRLKESRGV